VKIVDEQNKSLYSQKIRSNKLSVVLAVAKKYTVEVSAEKEGSVASEVATKSTFVLQGPALSAPRIELPRSRFVRQLEWSPSKYADDYDFILWQQNPVNKKWDLLHKTNLTATTLNFDSRWPGGKYMMQVQATGQYRLASKLAKIKFSVAAGDRSPASEMASSLKQSIDRVQGWYGIASYLITALDYTSVQLESNAQPSTTVLGGTGRLGLGYFSPKNPWGFLGILDLSGFTLENKNYTFASSEISVLYRINSSDRSEVRLLLGAYYKEIPTLTFDRLIGVSEDWRDVPYSLPLTKVAGPHAGIEYWYSLNNRLGFQVNAHVYTPTNTLSTPNGQKVKTQSTTQLGLLGSYRWNPRFTGLVGYARREDIIVYDAVPSASNFVQAGDVNSIKLTGNYLNLFAEWSF
jgi:hypothetical protein